MNTPLKRELAAEQTLLSLRNEVGLLTRRADWEKASEIENRFEKQRSKTERLYHRDHDKRFDMAATLLAKGFDQDWYKLKRRKDPRSLRLTRHITARSKVEVEHDHRRRMTVIKEHEAKELGDLIQSAHDRENGPQPSEVPKRITDQRDDHHRTGPNRDR